MFLGVYIITWRRYLEPRCDIETKILYHIAFEVTIQKKVSPEILSYDAPPIYPTVCHRPSIPHRFMGVSSIDLMLKLLVGGVLYVWGESPRERRIIIGLLLGDFQGPFLRTKVLFVLKNGLTKKWRIMHVTLLWYILHLLVICYLQVCESMKTLDNWKLLKVGVLIFLEYIDNERKERITPASVTCKLITDAPSINISKSHGLPIIALYVCVHEIIPKAKYTKVHKRIKTTRRKNKYPGH